MNLPNLHADPVYRCEFEREKFIVLRPVALEIAENAIRSSRLWAERRGELKALAREEVNSEIREGHEKRLEPFSERAQRHVQPVRGPDIRRLLPLASR
jgi:hypothetical protein